MSGTTRGQYATVSQNDIPLDVNDFEPHEVDGSEIRHTHIPKPSTSAKGEVDIDDNVSIPSLDEGSSGLSANHHPSEFELRTLRKVPDRLPWSTFLIAVVELCERFAYYGLIGPFQNYMANAYHDPNGLPGAIGLNQSGATALSSFFQFWCYVTPILGAIVADQYLGKYLTIVYFSFVYMVGIAILFVTSLPYAIEHGAALGGLIIAMIVIGLGTGGIKSNVSPLIAEQYTRSQPIVKSLMSGERVIVDPEVTIQRIYMIYYLCINIGSLSAVLTTNLELHVGFWAAYFLPLLMFAFGCWVLIRGKRHYVIRPPQGSIITQCFRALWIGVSSGGDMDAAKPSRYSLTARRYRITWDDSFVEELKRALGACKVFLFYPIYWAAFNQMSNNFVTQAGQMQLHGIPNDIMQNIDPLSVVIFIPICDRILYPMLRRAGFPFKPITRIFWGFLLAGFGMLHAAFVQHKIYTTGPCYDHPAACAAALKPNGQYAPNDVHIALQIPAYLFIGLSEILASVTGLEYAFAHAPPSMKSFIMSIFLLTTAVGSALGLVISPMARDPYLTWMYLGLAMACIVTGGLFWRTCRKLDMLRDGRREMVDPDAFELEGVVEERVSSESWDSGAAK